MALLRLTRLLITEKSATYTVKWSYTIIWQVRVVLRGRMSSNFIDLWCLHSGFMRFGHLIFINQFSKKQHWLASTASDKKGSDISKNSDF
jgi:hypothetical protein